MLFALVVAPPAAADLADERALAEKYAPIVRIVEQQDVCSYGEPFIPTDIDLLLDEETVALRGPWNITDLVEIASHCGRSGGALRIPPRLPGQCARSGLRLQPLGSAPDGGQRARRVRARRRRGGVLRKARPSVLVLLPLQRLQQHARGRLGDDPARLRRARRPSRARGRPRSRSVTARTREPNGQRGTTRSSSSPGQGPSSTRPPAPTPTSTGTRSGWAARRRQGSAATTRAGHTASCPRRSSRSRATGRPQRPPFPGSPSRGAGASSRRRSSTGRPARTRRRSGRGRSPGPRTGAT